MKIAFIGYGKVGGTLAIALSQIGHHIILASRGEVSPHIQALVAQDATLHVAPMSEAIEQADVVFLTTPFPAASEALDAVKQYITGKIVVDCTNPVGPGLTHGLKSVESGTELLQKQFPTTNIVKAFTIYGYENFVAHPFAQSPLRPAMLFCGNDSVAKSVVASLIDGLGWEPIDVGGAYQAVHLEHMTLLWIDYIRKGGHNPRFVWAAVRE